VKKPSRFWIWVIKLLIIIVSYGYIYYQIFYKKNDFEPLRLYHFDWTKIGLLLLVFILMFVNWSMESIKWKILVSPLEKISFWHSFKGILIGLTTSIFTPNRTGEYFGRIWVLSQKRVQGVFATITGSIAQLSITLIVGIFSLIYIPTETLNQIPFIANNKNIILFISTGLTIVIIVFLFFIFLIPNKLIRFKKLFSYLKFLKYYSFKSVLKILILSIVRYFIFIIQFFLLIQMFNILLNFKLVFMLLAFIYFIMAFIPSFTFAEIGIRGSLAITIFNTFVPSTIGIFLAISILWIINIALPAFVGSFFTFKLKIKI